jgi:two-component system sensor histidine kinase ArlS
MKFKFKNLSISKKLTLTYSSILLGILISFTFLTYYSLGNFILRENEDQLAANTDTISNYIVSSGNIDKSNLDNIKLSTDTYFVLVDEKNNILYMSKDSESTLEKRKNELNIKDNDQGFEHEKGIIYTSRVINIKGKAYYLQVIKEFQDIGSETGALEEVLIITGILGTLISVITGLFLTKRFLKPIKDITNTAREITSKNLDTRIVAGAAEDELKELADTFNLMIERLEVDFEKQRRFVSDASHELRTPLSVIYGHVNMLNRWGKDDPKVLMQSLTVLKSETENMNKLIENLLFLAKGDNDVLKIKKEEFEVCKLIKEIVEETFLNHEKLNLKYVCDESLKVNADYNSIKQVLRILVDNSMKFSKPDGEILIKAEKTDAGTRFMVEDKGSGISAESLPFIFDRFYRADESRTKATGGTGLGLSIAKQIIQNHNGKIWAESELGSGTKIIFTI